LQDVANALDPDERLGIDVVMHDVFIDGAATSSGTLANMPRRSRSVCDVAQETLDHVQPRGRGWSEVHVESWMLVQPRLHSGVLMGGVIVGNQVQRLALGGLAINLAQQLQPFDVRVALLALPMTRASSTLSAANRVVVPLRS
jgi:hypothetical protein